MSVLQGGDRSLRDATTHLKVLSELFLPPHTHPAPPIQHHSRTQLYERTAQFIGKAACTCSGRSGPLSTLGTLSRRGSTPHYLPPSEGSTSSTARAQSVVLLCPVRSAQCCVLSQRQAGRETAHARHSAAKHPPDHAICEYIHALYGVLWCRWGAFAP